MAVHGQQDFRTSYVAITTQLLAASLDKSLTIRLVTRYPPSHRRSPATAHTTSRRIRATTHDPSSSRRSRWSHTASRWIRPRSRTASSWWTIHPPPRTGRPGPTRTGSGTPERSSSYRWWWSAGIVVSPRRWRPTSGASAGSVVVVAAATTVATALVPATIVVAALLVITVAIAAVLIVLLWGPAAAWSRTLSRRPGVWPLRRIASSLVVGHF